MYLDTERRFSGKRVRDIASARFPEAYATPASLAALLPRIHVLTPDSAGSLLQQLEVRVAVWGCLRADSAQRF